MIRESLHFPTVYDPRANRSENTGYYYDVIIGMLRDLEPTGVLLVDSAGLITSGIESAIERWPAKYRKSLQMARTYLHRHHRLVAMEAADGPCSCGGRPCHLASGIAEAKREGGLVVILPDQGLVKGPCVCRAARTVTVGEYVVSDVSQELRRSLPVIVPDGLSRAEFEERYLEPLFRHAKHVKIFDRWIGRSQVSGDVILDARENHFLPSIAWLFEQFCASGPSLTGRSFEVTTGIESNGGTRAAFARRAVHDLKSWASTLPTSLGCDRASFRLIVRQESPGRELPHARYLITDQVALQVDPGFDLLVGRRKDLVREATFSLAPEDGGKIDLSFRRCPEFEF